MVFIANKGPIHDKKTSLQEIMAFQKVQLD